MGNLQLRQIRKYLEQTYNEIVDVSDVTAGNGYVQNVFLARALATFVLTQFTGADAWTAAVSLTDGEQDNGLDAVYHDTATSTLYLVTTQWNADGQGCLSRSALHAFLSGVADLTFPRYERFNEKLQRRSEEVDAALLAPETSIVLLIAYSGQDDLGPYSHEDMEELAAEYNDITEVMSYHVLKQDDIYKLLIADTTGSPVDVEVLVRNWGINQEPYPAYYGLVSAGDIANWFDQYSQRLFAPNIRMYLGPTMVNRSIVQTLLSTPERFWYFNNGITVLCSRLQRKNLGGVCRELASLQLQDVMVVNGAQTVGAIAEAHSRVPDRVQQASVFVRFISLEDCPPEFARDVTKATNTQNRIEVRDFVTLDDNHERLRVELALEGIHYLYKAGAKSDNPERSFDLHEATVALACAHPDVTFSVIAKASIGTLWNRVGKPPYTELFHDRLTGRRLWRLVQIMRLIDTDLEYLETLVPQLAKRETFLLRHGNRFLAYEVMQRLPLAQLEADHIDLKHIRRQIRTILPRIITAMQMGYKHLFPRSYVANTFKSRNKCRQLHDYVHQMIADRQSIRG